MQWQSILAHNRLFLKSYYIFQVSLYLQFYIAHLIHLWSLRSASDIVHSLLSKTPICVLLFRNQTIGKTWWCRSPCHKSVTSWSPDQEQGGNFHGMIFFGRYKFISASIYKENEKFSFPVFSNKLLIPTAGVLLFSSKGFFNILLLFMICECNCIEGKNV